MLDSDIVSIVDCAICNYDIANHLLNMICYLKVLFDRSNVWILFLLDELSIYIVHIVSFNNLVYILLVLLGAEG